MAILPPFNFLTLHYAYFIFMPLVCSAIFWGASRQVSYVDSLFLCVSAITGAGLNTVCPSLDIYNRVTDIAGEPIIS